MRRREREATATGGNPGSRFVLLSISPHAEDHAVLKEILDPALWQVEEAAGCEEAFQVLASRPVEAIVTSDTLPDGDWLRVLRQAQSLPRPPKLIVASHLADDGLWLEVLSRGGYDLVAKPFQSADVRRVVAGACSLPACAA